MGRKLTRRRQRGGAWWQFWKKAEDKTKETPPAVVQTGEQQLGTGTGAPVTTVTGAPGPTGGKKSKKRRHRNSKKGKRRYKH